MRIILKKIAVIISLLTFLFSSNLLVYAQDVTPTTTDTITPTGSDSTSNNNSSQIEQLNKKIHELENKVSDLHSQANSLSSQIGVMDNQIKLTEYKINSTKQEIMDTTLDIDSAAKRMKNLEGSLTDVSKVLINRIKATYQVGSAGPMQIIFASNDMTDFLSRVNYLKLVQEHDKQLLYNTQQARNDYANQKAILESKKKKIESLKTQLEGYTKQLDQEKTDKETLLSVTKNDEQRYQGLLAEARAQINAFKSFATSQVGSGASILPPQASPDGWYYNQRDSRWGTHNIGSSSEPVWEVGCLLTSIAMVLKKHGEGVTPLDVASNGSYFFSNTAYMLIPWAGGKISPTWGYNQSDVDSKLANGEPVIVGLKAGPYGMHFIVLKSGSGGSYIMNDPWNGPDLTFSSYYSTGQIFQYGYYN